MSKTKGLSMTLMFGYSEKHTKFEKNISLKFDDTKYCLIFAPFLKTISLFSRRFFHKILSLCLFSIQERIMMACLWYVNPISTRMGRLCPPIGFACLKNVLITPLPVSFFCALTTRRRCLWESVVLRYLTNFLCNLDSRLEPTNFCCF